MSIAHRSKFKYSSQFKASRAITACAEPTLQSVSQTIETCPPKNIPLSQEEAEILAQLDPSQFSVVTPVNKLAFDYLTQKHPNRAFIQYLRNGLEHGFRFNFSGKRVTKIQENLKSIDIEPSALTNYINSEIAIGRMCGPFSINNPPCSIFQVNPCGLVEKKNTNPKVYRVISHLSSPLGTSINDGIDRIEFATKYENLNHAIGWITKYGRGCLLSKIDIQDAYRILPVHPVDQVLQGLQNEGNLYFDKALAFGNRASGGIFCRFADIITWIAVQQGIKSVIHYVDDFLIISKSGAQQDLEQFLRILKILNIPYKKSKLEGPCTTLTFLGIRIDTNAFSAAIPEAKKLKIMEMLTEWQAKTWCYKKELQSLVGSLMWLCQTMPQGRPFVQRFIKALGGNKNSKFHIRINSPMKADIAWWQKILPIWSGMYFMEDRIWLHPNTQNLYTDASNLGGGATYDIYFTAFNWSQAVDITKHSIQMRELLTCLIAMMTFAPLWLRKRLIIWTDNQANAEAFYSGFCRNSIINKIIASMYMAQIRGNYSVKLEHIAGKNNKDADLLSRNGHKQFRMQNPLARYLNPVIPDEYTNLITTFNL
ncbi:7121_t:CDS:1 [Dentiscutata heterogama]|uniref:7121_t:CDS:1 n=1 Tax=Dentiscutata heterogama TaxID=1316150 RepID=A0ACA9NFV1_9GLOM|nr:7121_t:CDS:1 [Dentiscutata heterogama]